MPEETKPCLFCDKQLEPACPNAWETRQPWGGGEVKFLFAYGSEKYDLNMSGTVFRAYVCDDCASKFVQKMERSDGSF